MGMDVVNWNNFQFCQLSTPHSSLENRKLQERIVGDAGMYVSLDSNACDYAFWAWQFKNILDRGGNGLVLHPFADKYARITCMLRRHSIGAALLDQVREESSLSWWIKT